MRYRNTQTTKKYAIDLIQEIKDKAYDKVNAIEKPCAVNYKLEAVKKGKAVFDFNRVKRLATKSVKEYATGYGNHANVKVSDIVEDPEAYSKALHKYHADQPRVKKKHAAIDAAHFEAEKAVMLGGGDSKIALAIEKLERLIG